MNSLDNQKLIIFIALLSLRKIPWVHVQTEDSHEKEPEVISTVGQNDTMSKVKLSEFPSQKELMEKELEARNIGNPFKMPLLQANCDCVVEKCAVIITNGVVT